MTAVVALVVAWPSMRSVWALNRVLAATDNRVVVEQYFAEHVPAGSSLLQSGSRFGHARFAGRLGYKEWRWDGGRNTFMLDGARASGRPDWILLQDSPLPSTTQDIVSTYLHEGYATVAQFKASTLDADIVYDRQDAFFVPFTGLERVVRPGPNFTLFKRNDSAVQSLDTRASGR